MKKILFILVVLMASASFCSEAAEWKATVTWPAVVGVDADASINVLCDVNAPAITWRGRVPPGGTLLLINFTANQGDTVNCATQLQRGETYGVISDTALMLVPFTAPGKGPTPGIIIESL